MTSVAAQLVPGLLQLTPQRAQDFYGEHKGKSFFDTLVKFMTSGPVYALVLSKQDAIKEWRSLMGPTNSNTARAEKPKRCAPLTFQTYSSIIAYTFTGN